MTAVLPTLLPAGPPGPRSAAPASLPGSAERFGAVLDGATRVPRPAARPRAARTEGAAGVDPAGPRPPRRERTAGRDPDASAARGAADPATDDDAAGAPGGPGDPGVVAPTGTAGGAAPTALAAAASAAASATETLPALDEGRPGPAGPGPAGPGLAGPALAGLGGTAARGGTDPTAAVGPALPGRPASPDTSPTLTRAGAGTDPAGAPAGTIDGPPSAAEPRHGTRHGLHPTGAQPLVTDAGRAVAGVVVTGSAGTGAPPAAERRTAPAAEPATRAEPTTPAAVPGAAPAVGTSGPGGATPAAATPGAAAAPPASATPPASFADALTGSLARLRLGPRGDHVLTVHVTPEDLGPVRVQAHIGADGVRIELLGTTEASREALRAVLPDLRRDLAGTGLAAELRLGADGRGDPGQPGSGAATSGGGGRADGRGARAADVPAPAPRPSPHAPPALGRGLGRVDLYA